jgi:ATP-binding cassette subfamily F protein uup
LADGSIFTTQPDLGVQLTTRLAEIEDELLTALTRWEELDARL